MTSPLVVMVPDDTTPTGGFQYTIHVAAQSGFEGAV